MRTCSVPVTLSREWYRTSSLRGYFKIVAALTLMASAVPVTDAWGQGATKATSQDLALTTKDGFEIKITYFKSPAGQEAPVVVMLHGKGGNRLVWKGYAELLQQKAEYAVITVDLRGHGESTANGGATGKKTESTIKAKDYGNMIAFDMEAIKKFIFDEHQSKNLNMNKLAIVAADVTTPIAIAYTEVDWAKQPYDDSPTPGLGTPRGQDVQAIALLSPESNAPGVPIPKALGDIRNLRRPVLIAFGAKNAGDQASAKKVYEVLSPKKEDPIIVYKPYEVKLRGTDLLGQGLKVEEDLFNFLFEHVKSYKSPWRDRKSPSVD